MSGLLNLLVRKQHLLIDKAQQIQIDAKAHEKPVALYLIESGFISSAELSELCVQEYGTPLFDLSTIDVKTIPEDLLNEKLVQKHFALPLYIEQNRLYVATADPTDVAALEDFQFSTGKRTEPLLVGARELAKAIENAIEDDISALNLGEADASELAGVEVADQSDEDAEIVKADDKDDAPIVVYINKLLMDAIRKGASDLHFEPYEKSYRVRFRIDGILNEISSPPQNMGTRIAARLKVMSRLDIAERRVPQDGRIKLRLSRTKSIDFRVSTLPTIWGEKIVLRILDSSSAMLGIDALGYEPEQKQLYMDNLKKPQGMILVTGPTGSGKTVSLYTGLNILNEPERNISTAEDPVEINLQGINQVHVNPKAGLTFASALRSFLRQDPDVVMVGEIRDLETAEIAIKAAQTGHLVLSTLHTNSAAETLTRLLNMGVPSFNVASSVSLIIAQRLGRRLCKNCKAPEEIADKNLLELGYSEEQVAQGITIYKPVGCDACTGGYKGRVGIYEVMPMTDKIARIIMEGGNSLDIARQMQADGVANLRQSALKKAMQGVTSLAEVERVTSF